MSSSGAGDECDDHMYTANPRRFSFTQEGGSEEGTLLLPSGHRSHSAMGRLENGSLDKSDQRLVSERARTRATPPPLAGGKALLGTVAKQFGSCVMFGTASVLIIAINKIVLTSYQFPSFQVVGLGQILATITVLWVARFLNIVSFPTASREQMRKIFPLPLFYLLNLIFGLGSTKKLNLPMFTVLRRFTIIFIAIGQIPLLHKYESLPVLVSLFMMVAGAGIAALNDLTFNLTGYFFILFNDFATAANGLYTKKKMNQEMNKYELMFYNALIVLVPAFLLAAFSGDLEAAYNFTGWTDPLFVLSFFLSCIMGFVLIFTTILCTQLTSPLSVTVVGCIKNILVTYGGMFIGGDYTFEAYNFIGINVSVMASLVYSMVKYREQQKQHRQKQLLPGGGS